MAVAAYHDRHKHLPPALQTDEDGNPAHSWRVLLLPYLDSSNLSKRYSLSEPWDGPNNRVLLPEMPGLYVFHGDHRPGETVTSYLAVVGKQTVWPREKPLAMSDVKDGTAHTILIVENLGAGVAWTEPRDLSFAGMSFTVNDPGGVSSKYRDPAVAMLDCTILRLSKDTSPGVLRALLTANGGEKVECQAGEWELLSDGRDRVE